MKITDLSAINSATNFGTKPTASDAVKRAMDALTPKAEVAPTSSSVEQMVQQAAEENHAPAAEAQVEAPAEEPALEEQVKAAPERSEEESLSPRYAALVKREKALRMRDQQLKAREQALRDLEQKTAQPPQPAQQPRDEAGKFISKDDLLKSPFKVLNELGLNYDKLTEMLVDAPSYESSIRDRKIEELEKKLAELEGETKSTRKTIEEREAAAEQQTKNQLLRETKRLVELDANYEMIKSTDSVQDVVDRIEKVWKEEGYLMTVDEAAQQIEDELLEQAIKISKLSKIQKRLAPAPSQASKVSQPIAKSDNKQPQLTTLTNQAGTARKLTPRERALMVARGEKIE